MSPARRKLYGNMGLCVISLQPLCQLSGKKNIQILKETLKYPIVSICNRMTEMDQIMMR
jgi:hypothetical protein